MTATPETLLTHTTGVVLAGGGSRRMGTSKAALVIAGEPLLRRVVGRLRATFADILVVGPPGLAELAPGVAVIQDRRAGAGPLGGLEAALATIATPRAFVIACDMPFVSPSLARHMAELAAQPGDPDAVVLRTIRGCEPLHAVYSVSCLRGIQAQLDAEQRSMRRLLGHLHLLEITEGDIRGYDTTGLTAFNANTPTEWDTALRLAAD